MSLSDKMMQWGHWLNKMRENIFFEKDIKDSIQELKKDTDLIPRQYQKLFNMRIDKVFGDALCTSAEVKE